MKDQAAFLQNLCAFLDLKLNIVDKSAIIRRHLGFPWSQAPRAVYKSGTGTRGRGHRDACVGTWDLGTRDEGLGDVKYGTRGRGDVKN